MWIPALMGQASEEQQQRWLPPSQRLEVNLPTRGVRVAATVVAWRCAIAFFECRFQSYSDEEMR